MNPVRDASATARCGLCAGPVSGRGDKRWCSTQCRQQAWRRRTAAPVMPVVAVAKADTVYECDRCGVRCLDQRCPDCNLWCRRVGPGGCCPHCEDLVAIGDIVSAEQLVTAAPAGRRAK